MNRRHLRSQSVVACVLACCCCHPRTGAVQLYDQAVRALRDGNAKQALELARKAEKRCPPIRSATGPLDCLWPKRS